MKKIICVQPECVREFKCDGSKCNARCCRGWQILIDKETHAQFRQLADAEKILALTKFNSELNGCFVTLDGMNCPFLNENNLCHLQLKYGEGVLSQTCATYPRRLFDFKIFVERSLVLSCPVAAEIILLRDAPLKFELVEMPRENLCGGRLEINDVIADENFCEKMFNLQVTAISILQRRTLTLDQRLIALGFFLDKFDEIFAGGMDNDALEKLFAAYESESFWAEQFPKMLTAVHFDAENFWELMLKVLVEIYGGQLRNRDKKFLAPLIETFGIVPDEKNQVFVAAVAANYKRLAAERKKFLSERAMFLENFLVNEFFMDVYPWNFKASVTKNFGVLVTKYKLFELMTFAASQKKFNDKELIELTSWLMRQADHEKFFTDSILATVPDDIFSAMETLLEP